MGTHISLHSIHLHLVRQSMMIEMNLNAAQLLESNKIIFREFHHSCDSVHHQLHSEKIRTNMQHAPPFTDEEEDTVFSHGIHSCVPPICLQCAVF